MDTPTPLPTARGLRFHLTLADRSETDAIERYLRQRRLAVEIADAVRRADAVMRLEFALRPTAGSRS